MNTDELAKFCKENGFVYQAGDIYGTFAGFFDYGPVGVEIINNIKQLIWKVFVQSREDVVGIDGAIITNPKVWEASGHASKFADPITECKKCKKAFRADHIIEDALKIPTDGINNQALTELISKNKIKCPECKGELNEVKNGSLMLVTQVGPLGGVTSYLRPETAQSIFSDYKPVIKSTRVKPPFGIAQIGKAFRNEISPRNFLFRCREFSQFELEYFIKEKEKNNCSLFSEVANVKVNVLSAKTQEAKKNLIEELTIKDCLSKGYISNEWHAYWIGAFYKFLLKLGINPKKLRIREQVKAELSFYSGGTNDIEYEFPNGWKELQGIANRQKYDLGQHQAYSGESLEYFDEETKNKELLYVIEPSIGIDRLFLVLMFDSLVKEGERTVLKIDPRLAPWKAGIFPLVKNDPALVKKAREVYNLLRNDNPVFYDESGSIGRRYRRMDEIGTPVCITIDEETLSKGTVTLRDRDSMKQIKLKIEEVEEFLNQGLKKGFKQ